ncbi:MAG: VCBS repeat-containing protein [Saprospiraceae bacterium]|nr:VCBS repeat-containing protein [Saprospiraceae bacterium]
MRNTIIGIFIATILLLTCGCQPTITSPNVDEPPIFSGVSADESGLDFVNKLEETLESNYYQYNYTYIGGGVAAGDLDNDGLIDLAFTANQDGLHLYRNLGDLQFEKVTHAHPSSESFYTGITMADINADGLLDIYVSKGGWDPEQQDFRNELYLNQGNFQFSEAAAEQGLDDGGRGIQATFFDYDRDNDLDVYISNTPDVVSRAEVLDLAKVYRDPGTLQQLGSDRLYMNTGNGRFRDVSQEAGLVFDLGFGLSPQVMDFNNDGWLDIYVCNDFNSPDLAYINNGDGTFREGLEEVFKHVSFNSMGSDIADFNNDGMQDLITLDMNPADYVRSKTTMGMTSIDVFENMVRNGYHHQYMHNMLQLNNGNGTFSEISQLSGIGNTDWSWSVLAADFDLDGWDDVFVTNGVYRDVLDRDQNNAILSILQENNRKPTDEDFLQFVRMLPQQKLTNFFFKNEGDLTFQDVSDQWIDGTPSFSNGATYADFDQDGDLDLVINELNGQATLLRNNAALHNENARQVKITLRGPGENAFAIGALIQVILEDGSVKTKRQLATRGFLSAVSSELYVGLGPQDRIRQIDVTWPDGTLQHLSDNLTAPHFDIHYAEADPTDDEVLPDPLFEEVPITFRHEDPYFNDYALQILLPHKLSQTGPGYAAGDVNEDGMLDLYIGGGASQPGQLLMGHADHGLQPMTCRAFDADRMHEDQGALFFDVNGDQHLDLYVVSGSYEFYGDYRPLQDRLYLGDGAGGFEPAFDRMPIIASAGSVVKAEDVDNDGDLDLFVGGRVLSAEYPYAPSSHLLINEKGILTDRTREWAPALLDLGMVTDAEWMDIDQDGSKDLIVCGEWMGIECLLNKGGLLTRKKIPLTDLKGWWNAIELADLDGDGDKDLVAGNLGLNYKYKASVKKPFHVYTSDFDFNGIEDVILAKNLNESQVPIRGKTCMTQQLPRLAQEIPSFQDFAEKDLTGIVGDLTQALHYEATEFRSGIFWNEQQDGFVFEPFDNALQIAPVNSIVFADLDKDGLPDLLLAGNNHQSEVETTRADAGIGHFLQGLGDGKFAHRDNHKIGFFAQGDVRALAHVPSPHTDYILVVNNNSLHQLYKVEAKNSVQ